MRRFSSFSRFILAPGTLGAALTCLHAPAAEPIPTRSSDAQQNIRLIQAPTTSPTQPPAPSPTQPPAPSPTQPPAPSPESGAGTTPSTGGEGGGQSLLGTGALLGGGGGTPTPGTSQAAAGPGAANVAGGQQAQALNTSDAGDLLNRSQAGTGVEVQRRSPVVTDPRVRGYHIGELYTTVDGIFAIPTRQDLDTIASKVDSDSIRNATVIKGPYSVRYGPGLAFIDIETLGTARYENGFEGHGSTSMGFKTNGEQWRGRQAFWGGSTDWGFRIGYDLGAGVDYQAGNAIDMPSSYNQQNIDFALGWNLSQNSRLELRILRQDLEDVELPGQIFNIAHGITDSYSARLYVENQECFDRATTDVWYSYGRFNGNNLSEGTRQLIPILNYPQFGGFVGFTDASTITPGFSQKVTWGKEKESQVTLGFDLRYVSQRLNEFDYSFTNITFTGGPGQALVNNPIPLSHSLNPGVFLDNTLLVNEWFTLKGGTRADFVFVNLDSLPAPGTTLFSTSQLLTPTSSGHVGEYGSNYNLLAGYITGEAAMTNELTAYTNMGIGQRPPTLTELYAQQPFLAVVQNGFNYVVGNPFLSPEQAWQMDIGVRANYQKFRGEAAIFYAWIHNYITFQEVQPTNTGINGLQYVNTDRATLSGFELRGEYDLYDWLSPFATMAYVEGRDETRDSRGSLVQPQPVPGSNSSQEPLPGIPPLDTRIGLRFHEAGKQPKYGVEVLSRIVSPQNRYAQSLQEVATPGFTIWDLRSYWQANRRLLLTAGVENIFDKTYREHLDLRTGAQPANPALVNGQILQQGLYGPGVLQPGVNFYFGAQLTY